MYIAAAIVMILVTVLILQPVLHPRKRPVNRRLFLWGGGVVLPLLTLTALVPYIMTVGQDTRRLTSADELSVDVTGYQFWWEMSYWRAGGPSAAVSADELRIGRPSSKRVLVVASV